MEPKIEILYSILDRALVLDPKVANAAKNVDIGFVTDESYIWNRYGITRSLFRRWVKDRKLFNSEWQNETL